MTTLPLSPAAAGRGRTRGGAGNRVRTGDLNLGKVTLYQLSYSRCGRREFCHRPRPLSTPGAGRGPSASPVRQPNGFDSRASKTPITAMYSPENANPMIRYGNHGRL